ncbi:hypothetical protein H634G_02208 [Metarhizium anisopliae BRIP 53293]|uniref:DUF7728 domain-containing protein n=1 Tax=Metarhizium anisopliae BRIP 53293 TaxID=1291518 RepID=A0A0D9P8M7_METAN|nr:hypothetical protein H634G_02208 [Metarhizium anisopliae BRIP 53293]KJK89500.1 hypothetical protein H633G_06658 [Metarhizium anisopliae BRIP 53284]
MSVQDDSSLLPTDQGQCLNIRCKHCPTGDGHIRLEFTVDENRKLLVNGFELFPSHGDGEETLMTANVHDVGGNAKAIHEEAISYELSTATKEKDEIEGIELIDVDYKIRQVDSIVVQDVPTVHVRLIKLPGDDILIGVLTTSEEEDYDADCGAVQCWAYKLSFGALGSAGDMIPSCCSKSSTQANHTSSEVDWRPSLNWEKTSLQGLQLGVFACLLLALLAMFCFRCTNLHQKTRKARGVQFWTWTIKGSNKPQVIVGPVRERPDFRA